MQAHTRRRQHKPHHPKSADFSARWQHGCGQSLHPAFRAFKRLLCIPRDSSRETCCQAKPRREAEVLSQHVCTCLNRVVRLHREPTLVELRLALLLRHSQQGTTHTANCFCKVTPGRGGSRSTKNASTISRQKPETKHKPVAITGYQQPRVE